MNDFILHPTLQADTLYVAQLPLCSCLLLNDQRYPWLVLVPRVADIREIHQLKPTDQLQLMQEISAVSARLSQHVNADKINVAALGNIVAQLHVHIVARFTNDATWPAPIWGVGQAKPYPSDQATEQVAAFAHLLTDMID